ncbi:hypothetical protein BJ170DRAFT_611708 [Xylariales sp. AK1849]|nr:hypothetical protein BJ170DRAFT_611708 [Xylariales sp. AK1849]
MELDAYLYVFGWTEAQPLSGYDSSSAAPVDSPATEQTAPGLSPSASLSPSPVRIASSNLTPESSGEPASMACEPRRIRQRAPIACQPCRDRKVRCDTAVTGIPCSNCAFHEDACAVITRKGKRDARRVHPSRKEHHKFRYVHKNPELVSLDGGYDEVEPSPSADHSQGRNGQPRLLFHPLPATLNSTDVMLLRAKCAMDVPRVALGGMLESFCRYTFWQVPVVDLHQVSQLLYKPHCETKVSLLLSHAIMLAASLHAPLSVFREAGYESRAVAYQKFYEGFKILYILECEKYTITLVRALLLVAYACNHSAECDKYKVFWITAAVSLCYSIGLHKYPKDESSSLLSEDRGRMWRRIWWACYVLDHSTALRCMNRPCINRGDWDVPPLKIEDFELDDLKRFDGPCGMRQLAECFIQRAHFCTTTNPPNWARPSSWDSFALSNYASNETTEGLWNISDKEAEQAGHEAGDSDSQA